VSEKKYTVGYFVRNRYPQDILRSVVRCIFPNRTHFQARKRALVVCLFKHTQRMHVRIVYTLCFDAVFQNNSRIYV